MNKIDVQPLTEVQETLLIPLWARAEETHHPSPILRDPKAVQLVDSIDYDFSRFARAGADQAGFCIRASIVDRLVREILERQPASTVVEFGAGLDSRFERIDNGRVQWFDLDLPDAMAVRRQFFEQSERRRFLSSSVFDFQWMDEVSPRNVSPHNVSPHNAGQVLFVVEGVLLFFPTDQVRQLFISLADRFPGSVIIFDTHSPFFNWFLNRLHPLDASRMIWSVRDVRALERWHPRFQLEQSIGFGDSPYFDPHFHRLRPLYRLARRLFPPSRHMFRINQLRLGESPPAG